MAKNTVSRTKGTPRFELKNPNSNKETPINLVFSFGRNKKFKKATGFKIHPDLFDRKRQQVKQTAKASSFRYINQHLNDIKAEVNNIVTRLENKNSTIDIEDIKHQLDIYLGNIESEDNSNKKLDFFEYAEELINKKSNTLTEKSILIYKQLLRHLSDYEKDMKVKITFESIDLDFYYSFLEHMETKTYGNDQLYSKNTIGKLIGRLKTILNAATNDGINNNLKFNHPEFQKPSELTTQIYLTNEEIERIAMHDFSKNKELELARDIFIIGCETGQRVSDYNGIQNPNIETDEHGNSFVEITQKKTNKTVYCFITDLMKQIMSRYDGEFPPKLPDQYINERLKLIGRMLKINNQVQFKRTEGGKVKIYYKKKWEMISSHTARRSFCTNKYISGVPVNDIMHLSGHTSEKAFARYIRIEDIERTKKIINSKAFKNSLINL